MTDRRTKVQGYRRLGTEGTITWAEHEEVWAAYNRRYPGIDQDAEKIAERGGFGFEEAANLLGHPLTTFEPR